jgi:hypothetical protein
LGLDDKNETLKLQELIGLRDVAAPINVSIKCFCSTYNPYNKVLEIDDELPPSVPDSTPLWSSDGRKAPSRNISDISDPDVMLFTAGKKNKSYKNHRRGATKSKSRTRRGGDYTKEKLWEIYMVLQKESLTIKDPEELKKFGEEQLGPAFDAWERALEKEAQAPVGVGGKSRRRKRSHHRRSSKKHKKARKSRRRRVRS